MVSVVTLDGDRGKAPSLPGDDLSVDRSLLLLCLSAHKPMGSIYYRIENITRGYI